MNLMFRKNFRDQKSVSSSKMGKNSGPRHNNKRTNKDSGYTSMDEHHYRTHLFFGPPRCNFAVETADDDEPRCGPLAGSGDQFVTSSGPTIVSSANKGFNIPEAFISNNSGISQLNVPSGQTKQVSFKCNSEKGEIVKSTSALSGLEKDCFIIPVHSIHRFLPEGVTLPKSLLQVSDKVSTSDGFQPKINVKEIPDPKLCVLCHLMNPLEPIDSISESPLIQPLFKQRNCVGELLNEVAEKKDAITGMLLANMERNADFPFISYYVLNSTQINPVTFYNNLRQSTLAKFDPRNIRYTTVHSFDLYSEVATICRPPVHDIGTSLTKIHTPTTGYIISIYKVFEGDDKIIFERNWLYWTGARIIYRYMPEAAGLKRITLYKSLGTKGDKMYILICECANLLANVPMSAFILPALRARLIGYIGLFKPIQIF